MKKTCTRCGENKSIDQFRNRSKSKDGHAPDCKDCAKATANQHYRDHPKKYRQKAIKWREQGRKWFNEFLKMQICMDCGESDIVVLEFDHRGEKKHNVASLVGVVSVKKLMREIKKCDVVCANCHKRRTAKQFGWTKNKMAG